MSKLAGKVALIFGASSGIGRASALVLAREGAKVVVANRSIEKGLETVQMVKDQGGEADFVQTDVSVFEQVENAVNFAVERFGRLDIAFNNAGFVKGRPLLAYTPEHYDEMIKTNQYGVFHGILASGKKMKELGIEGVIINTSSVFGTVVSETTFAYHASKGAIDLMTKSSALEFAPYNIRVVGVAPGLVETPFIQGYRDMNLDSKIANMHLRGKALSPEDIAEVVAFLASDDSKIINGQVILADDGVTTFKSILR
jgi:glucose 1-dehydrogenase